MSISAVFAFTIWQAFLSAALSIALAIPLARAVARRDFWGRNLLIFSFSLPFFLSSLSIIVAVLSLFGRNGWLSNIIDISPFGLFGILFAHVLLNLPLAFRILLSAWSQLPEPAMRLTNMLATSPWQRFRLIEWPMLQATLPRLFLTIMLYCSLSFAIVLTFGGGPNATTVELAIYRAIQFDADFSLAAKLAVLQGALGLVLYFIIHHLDHDAQSLPRDFRARIWPTQSPWALDTFIISCGILFLITPLFALVVNGIAGIPDLFETVSPLRLGRALMNSLLLSFAATSLALVFAAIGRRYFEGLAYIIAAISPFALATVFIFLIRPFTNPFHHGLALTIIVQALSTLPLAIYLFHSASRLFDPQLRRITAQLGLSKRAKLQKIYWPIYRQPLLLGSAIIFSLFLGDVSVLPLLAPQGYENLALLILRLLGRYEFDAAAAMGFFLMLITFLILALAAKLGEINVTR